MASDSQSAHNEGVFDSLRRVSAGVLALAQTRLQLFSLEWEEERARLGTILLVSLLAFFFFAIALLLIVGFTVAVLWEQRAYVAFFSLVLLFLVLGAAAVWMVIRMLRAKPRLFHASLTELAKDRAQLAARK